MTTETPCPKAPHTGTGYLHAEDYDGPYDVDGVEYCGRCHYAIGFCRASNVKPAEPPCLPECVICGNVATCKGAYDACKGEYACDDCCGHGNEDGYCHPISAPVKREDCQVEGWCGESHHPTCADSVPAKPACECGAAIGHVCHAAECMPVCAYHSPTCPAHKAAEPLACKCGGNRTPNVAHSPDGCYSVPAEPQGSEPPMGRIEASERAMHANDRRMLDAYRAENAALKAENMRLAYGHSELQDKVDDLKARLCEREAESQAVMAALLGERVHHSQRTLEPVIYATALKARLEGAEKRVRVLEAAQLSARLACECGAFGRKEQEAGNDPA